ncbi:SurA N-terminal domain-containing protein [bacterium]|nr:SurA N-terminal domain-containing protein [bacterium]MBU1883592.1 SurA N-terminal domain-containing protein [bacterium]
MISWMQRHRKWLVITIWISTIAFIGAGFVGWGQYNYGKKASSVAKVGDVEITYRELQQSYGRIYAYFNKMFQGKFDEAQAKSFGLQKQALNQLINQALIINLANSYNLRVSDTEVLDVIKSEKAFETNGAFDKELYKTILSRNNLSTKEYESDLRKEILISKTLQMLDIKPTALEEQSLNTIFNIADKINYKILDESMIKIDTSDAKLKAFWEDKKSNFMNEPSYDVSYIVQTPVTKMYTDGELTDYYNAHKSDFEGIIWNDKIPDSARKIITKMLNDEETKKDALRTFVAYKKGELDKKVSIKNALLSTSKNIFTADVLKDISELSEEKPYLKPKFVNNEFVIIKLNKLIPAAPKSFNEAKAEVTALYVAQGKDSQMQELAQNTIATFNGKNTDFITVKDGMKIAGLSEQEGAEFLSQLFKNDKKRGFVTLSNKKIVLFNILEQKLLDNSKENVDSVIVKLKTDLLNQNLLETLRKRFKTEIFVEGL